MIQIQEAKIPGKRFKDFGLRLECYPDFLSFSREKRLEIAHTLTFLTGKGFMRFEIDDELIGDVQDHVAESSRLNILYDRNNKPQAFLCTEMSEWQGFAVFNLHGIMIDPLLQGKGLGRLMILAEFDLLHPEVIILTTQSINMYKLAQKVCFLSDQLAIEMARARKNIEGQVVRGAYRGGNSLYDDIERFAPYAIPWIDWRAGDALVVAGFVRKVYL